LARQKAAELKANASTGKNPIITQQARKAAAVAAATNTFEKLAREWFNVRRVNWENHGEAANHNQLKRPQPPA
jgi:hypothetical protein